MTRLELTKLVAKSTGLTFADAESALLSVIAEIKQALIHGEPVFIRGFGTFLPVHSKATKARNINKGETIILPPRYKPKFKPSKEFVAEMNNKKPENCNEEE